MLFSLKNYALFIAPAFRLNPSLLSATRRFLATSPSPSASTEDKPKRYLKKELVPPVKRPPSAFVAFASIRARKVKETSPTRVPYADTLREASAAWKKLSDAEKEAYAAPPEAYREYTAAAQKWYKELSPEAKKALKKFRIRKTGSGYSLFVSETFNDTKGDGFGGKIAEVARVWRSLSTEKKEEYSKRALQTLYGRRARRAATREKELKREAGAKRKAAERVKKLAYMKRQEARKAVLKRRARSLKLKVAAAKAKETAKKKAKMAEAASKARIEKLKKKEAAAAKAKKAEMMKMKNLKAAKAKKKTQPESREKSTNKPTTKAKTKA